MRCRVLQDSLLWHWNQLIAGMEPEVSPPLEHMLDLHLSPVILWHQTTLDKALSTFQSPVNFRLHYSNGVNWQLGSSHVQEMGPV